jgi:4-hydroxyphenylpyruvate dioxygenase
MYKPAIPTMSLGHGAAGHSMSAKLKAAKEAGFAGVEVSQSAFASHPDAPLTGSSTQVFYACLESFSLTLEGATPRDKLREGARQAAQMCKELGLEVVVLQPILNYDGIKDPKEHAERVEEIVFRFEVRLAASRERGRTKWADVLSAILQLCKLLGTDMIQIPANFRLDDGVTGDEDKVVADLRELAVRPASPSFSEHSPPHSLSLSQDLGAKESPPIRFVYEAMCWSTTNYTWQQSWRVVQKVDRPNFGAVLDAFHIAGYEYANPTTPGGVRPDGAARLRASLDELVKTIPGDRVFYVQLVDAERIDPPLAPLGSKEGSASPYYVEGQQPYMSWSRNCRLFPYEEERGAYMPIEQVCKAFLDTGFKGWIR